MKIASVLASLILLAPSGALGNTLVLKVSPTDSDGRVTIGDLFDNAGAGARVVVGYRNGGNAVLDAATVQMLASRNGMYWDNPRGQRRIIVTEGADDGDPFDGPAPAAAGVQQTAAEVPQAAAPVKMAAASVPVRKVAVVKRAEPVKVTWASNGMALTVTGIATKDAAIGDAVQLQNPTSKKMIDAVITGPGEALAGPAADQFRSRQLLSLR
jgi:flagella basal body P-ring formation protein FlgA